MNQLAFLEWLQQKNYGYPVSLLILPDKPDNAIAIELAENIGSRGTVTNMTLTFFIRSDHPANCIDIAAKINSDLDMTTKLFIENTQVILISSLTAVPVPLGIDENNRHIHQIQFKVLVSPTDKLNVRE